jgi:hypothetical protein
VLDTLRLKSIRKALPKESSDRRRYQIPKRIGKQLVRTPKVVAVARRKSIFLKEAKRTEERVIFDAGSFANARNGGEIPQNENAFQDSPRAFVEGVVRASCERRNIKRDVIVG